jgi:hypothetical protein
MYSKLSFISLGGTSLYPEEVLHFKDLMIFLISCAITGVKSVCPRGLLYTMFRFSAADESSFKLLVCTSFGQEEFLTK